MNAERSEIDAPVNRKDIGTGAGNGGEKMVRGLGVVNDRSLRVRRVQSGDDLLDRGEGERFVLGAGEFAAPGVEELDRSAASGNLSLQIRDCRL